MRLSLGAVVLAVCAVPLAWSPPAGPAAADSGSYSYNCPSSYVLIGVAGRQGSWMNAAWGICGRIRSNGTLNSGDRRVTTRAGGLGGTGGGKVCPPGKVLVGFTGTHGIAPVVGGIRISTPTYVHTIRTITCSTWDPTNRVATGGAYSYTAFPTKDPGEYIQTLCKYGTLGTGISGKAGSYLDTFSVKCVYAPYANPPVSLRPLNLNVGGLGWIVQACSRDIYGNCV